MSEDLKQKLSKASEKKEYHPDKDGSIFLFIFIVLIIFSVVVSLINNVWPFL